MWVMLASEHAVHPFPDHDPSVVRENAQLWGKIDPLSTLAGLHNDSTLRVFLNGFQSIQKLLGMIVLSTS